MSRKNIKNLSAACSIVNKTSSDAKQSIIPKLEDEQVKIKQQPVMDLNKFKFEKKPHIKIEYEEETPPKQVMFYFYTEINRTIIYNIYKTFFY